MALEVSKVKRLRGMVEAAIPPGKLDGAHAPALTSTYAALRQQIAEALDSPLREEFTDFFPELAVVEPPSRHPRTVAMFPSTFASAAEGAATKLRLMKGWLDALIAEHSPDEV
jgi:hypothetical protein